MWKQIIMAHFIKEKWLSLVIFYFDISPTDLKLIRQYLEQINKNEFSETGIGGAG
jgi:hypothetical protein